MNKLRYIIAIMLLAAIPAAILFWLMVHPFTRFWRRLGKTKTYILLGAVAAVVMASMVALRRLLLSADFGFSLPLFVIGLLFLVVSGVLLKKLRQKLTLKALVGVPELSPESGRGSLITDGVYAKIRHPRYTQMTLALFGYALIANYPAVYGAFAIWIVGIYAVTVLEERELEERFGQPYRDYRARVPRFWPWKLP